MKEYKKLVQKIRQSIIYMHNTKTQKNQPTKHTNNRVHTYERNPKNAKIQQCKKLYHWFGNYKSNKKQNSAGKSANIKKSECETIVHVWPCSLQAKYINYRTTRLHTWPTTLIIRKSQKRNSRSNFLKPKNSQFWLIRFFK